MDALSNGVFRFEITQLVFEIWLLEDKGTVFAIEVEGEIIYLSAARAFLKLESWGWLQMKALGMGNLQNFSEFKYLN